MPWCERCAQRAASSDFRRLPSKGEAQRWACKDKVACKARAAYWKSVKASEAK